MNVGRRRQRRALCLWWTSWLIVSCATLTAQEQDFPDQFPFSEELEEAAPAPRPQTEPAEAAFPPDDGRQSIELRVPAEKGGGSIVAVFRSASGDFSRYTLTGEVEIRYKDIRVLADQLVYDSETGDVFADGNVVLDQGPRRFSASGMELNIDTELGVFHDVVGYVTDDYYFTGRRVEKTGEDTYLVEDGTFSSCAGVSPPWSFKTRRLKITVDGYAKARGATFKIKKAPVLYFPYVLWPVRSDRSSGFLVPKPGFSSRRGPSLGLAYFQTFGRSFDTTFQLDLFGGGASSTTAGSANYNYLGIGNEFRYRPSEGTSGRFEGYAIRDPERDELRWRVRWDHRSENLPGGWRGVLFFEDASDFDYFLDFERRGDRNSRRQLYSSAFLTKNSGPHSLNILADNRRTFVSRDPATGTVHEVVLRQLPELDYKLRSTRLGKSPLYLAMRASAHYLDVDRNARQQQSYARGDLSPELTLPVRFRPWLSLSMSAGARLTYWQDSLYTNQEINTLPADEQPASDFRGESLTRFAPTAGLEIVGPSFSRIFEGGEGRYTRYKHVIEPRFTYQYFDTFDEEARIPVFDEIDNLRGSNLGRMALVNRLLAKEGGEDGGAAKEILSVELFQFLSFDPDQPLQFSNDRTLVSQKGPLGLLFRYNPSRRTTVRTEVSYNTLFSAVEDASLSATLGLGRGNDSLGLRWSLRRDVEADVARTQQVRFSAQLGLIPRRLNLSTQLTYDLETEDNKLPHQRYFLDYQGSCYRMSLEYSDLNNGQRHDQEYRFLVTLKNVGTFLDLSGGASERF